MRPVTALLALGLLVAAAGACSSTSEGEDPAPCTGVCTPDPVFARGMLSAVLVTPDAVFAADRSSSAIYAADKPLRTSRAIATNVRDVFAFVRTSHGLFWITSPIATNENPKPKGSLTWLADEAQGPVVLDADLERPRGLAVIGESVFVAVADGIRMLAAGATHLERAAESGSPYAPYALRSYEGALYWHDGLDTIFSWRPGEVKPQAIVEHANVLDAFEGSTVHDLPFVVDASGIYWITQHLGEGGELIHAPLAGGVAQTLLKVAGVPKALSTDDGAVYWTEADSMFFPKDTTIQRSAKAAPWKAATVGKIVGDAHALQSMPEGLYIAADPSVLDFDFKKLGFQQYGGSLLILPRAALDNRP